jgi:hypothetical protein
MIIETNTVMVPMRMETYRYEKLARLIAAAAVMPRKWPTCKSFAEWIERIALRALAVKGKVA